MKKKTYEKPSMKVYELNQQSRILVGSLGDPSDYQNGGDPFSSGS